MRYRLLVGNQVKFVTAADDSEDAFISALIDAGIHRENVSAVMKLGSV